MIELLQNLRREIWTRAANNFVSVKKKRWRYKSGTLAIRRICCENSAEIHSAAADYSQQEILSLARNEFRTTRAEITTATLLVAV